MVIHHAAGERDSFWLYEALKAGGNANLMNDIAVGSQKCRPLRFAINIGSLDNVILLVEYGADIDEIDRHEETPLTAAFRTTRFDIVLFLLNKGANYNMHVHESLSLIWYMRERLKGPPPKLKESQETFRAVYDWFLNQGMDVQSAKWDGKEWVFNREV